MTMPITAQRTTLSDVLGQVTDPFYSDNFELYIPKLPSPITSGDAAGLKIQCKSLSLPGVTNEGQDVPIHGFKIQAAGRTIFQNTMTVTFLENRNLNIYTTLKNWIYCVRDFRTQKSQGKGVFAVPAYILTFDETGNISKTLNVLNFWCSEVQDVNLDNSSANIVDISATFKFDYADETFSSLAQGKLSQATISLAASVGSAP